MKKLLATLSLLVIACRPVASREEVRRVTLVAPDGQKRTVTVEIADEYREQQQGLMFRESLASDSGMLFVFPSDEVLSFWMKNTRIALDIIFFDSEGRFVSSTTMAPCPDGALCPYYRSSGMARYALEAPAGYAQEHRIGEDWRLDLSSVQ